jgi:hypothetical protein
MKNTWTSIRLRLLAPTALALALAMAMALSIGAGVAQADSGNGVDTSLGNALNPAGTVTHKEKDPVGLGIQQHSRNPTGFLVTRPNALLTPKTTAGGWKYSGSVQLGVLGVSGDKREGKFREYKDLRSGAYLNGFELQMEKATSARFVEVLGGALGRDDQFFGLRFGRYNSWKLQSFYKDTGHVFTSSYRSLWNGVGSKVLTLKSLPPGGTANAATTDINIGNAALATPYSALSLVRQKGGLRLDMRLKDRWNATASYTAERRKGARPFGLVSGAGGGTGGVETAESINYYTTDAFAGLSYAGTLQSLNFSVAASMFRNKINTLTIENPMFVTPGAGITGIALFPRAVFDLYPDNNFTSGKIEYSRSLPNFMKGQFTVLLSSSRSSQNDALIPSTPYAGVVVNGVAGGSWDTTASLSRQSAGAAIGSRLADVALVLHPLDKFDVKAKARLYKTTNDLDYLACNPLTGQWGRLINDASGSAIVNTAAYLAPGVRCNIAATAALNVVPSGGNLDLRSIPYEYEQRNYTLSGDYRFNKSSLSAGFSREEFDRAYGERAETTDNRMTLGYVNRDFSRGTLRLSAESARRRGSTYNPDPFASFYSVSLGPLPTAVGTALQPWIRTNNLHRKYDLADRDQNLLNARFNMAIASTVDLSASVQTRENKYPESLYGRKGNQRQNSASVELNWQPLDRFSAYGSYSYQDSSLDQAGLQPNACVIGTSYNFLSDGVVQTTPLSAAQIAAGVSIVGTNAVTATNFQTVCGTVAATSPLYPTSRTWTISHREKSHDVTVGGNYDFSKLKLNVNYSYARSTTQIGYTYNAAALGLTPAQVALAGSGFPDMKYQRTMLETSALVPLSAKAAVRLYYRYEKGKIRDWHYDGVAQNPTPSTNQQTFLDSGPQDYDASVVGLFFSVGF